MVIYRHFFCRGKKSVNKFLLFNDILYFFFFPGIYLHLAKYATLHAAEQSRENFSDGNPRFKYYPNEHKRYECLNCSRRFTQKTTILRHLRYFCGQGHQYKCPYCHIKASCSSNIYRHVRARHSGKEARSVKLFSLKRDPIATFM